MDIDAALNSKNTSTPGEIGDQTQESSVARPSEPESPASSRPAPASGGEGSAGEGQAKAAVAPQVEVSAGAEENSSAGEPAGANPVGAARVATAPIGAAANPLEEALAALDDKDYATAKRLFAALGRKDAAEAIENALAALDRKDYATAQGLFEALAPPKPAAPAGQAAPAGPVAPAEPAAAAPLTASAGRSGPSHTRTEGQSKSAVSPPLEVIPSAGVARRRPPPPAARAKNGAARRFFLRTGFALIAIFVALALYSPRPNWTFAAAKSQAIAGLASAADLVKAPLEAVTGSKSREADRSAMRDFGAALTQVSIRLEQIEHDYGARLDELGQRVDKNGASRSGEIAARLDELEKKSAAPAAPASEFASLTGRLDRLEKRIAAVPAAPGPESADVATRLERLERKASAASAAPASEFAALSARLDKLEKKVGVSALGSAKAVPPLGPKPSGLAARAERSGADEIARLDNPGPVLRDFNLEDVRGGVAVIDGRYGMQQVSPGDLIPGAGRVLKIERRGGDWRVLTTRGVIASDPGY